MTVTFPPLLPPAGAGHGMKAHTPGVAEASGAPGFSDMVAATLQDTVQSVQAGEQAAQGSLDGSVGLTDLATAIAEAEVALQTLVAIRDRVVSAYQDIIKMPI